jgi:hypothetical protein
MVVEFARKKDRGGEWRYLSSMSRVVERGLRARS